MFKNPFSFDGRIRRTEYGISFIIYLALYIVITLLNEADGQVEALVALPLLIASLWFFWAQGAKRCHDRGKSGWFQIIPFYFLWLIFAEGDALANKYGPNPKVIDIP